MAYYSDIEHIKTAFLEKGLNEWELYSGTKTTRPNVDQKFRFLIDESAEGVELEESYNQLEDVLNRVSYKGGKAVLMLGNKDEKPAFVMPILLSKHTMTTPPEFDTGQRGGYNQGTSLGARSLNETLADKMRIYDLERQLENSGGGDVWSQIGNTIIEKIDPNMIVLAVSNLIAGITGKSIEMPKPAPTEPAKVGSIPAADNRSEDELEESIERLMQTVSSNLNDDPEKMKKLFENLEAMVRTNPAMLKQLAQ